MAVCTETALEAKPPKHIKWFFDPPAKRQSPKRIDVSYDEYKNTFTVRLRALSRRPGTPRRKRHQNDSVRDDLRLAGESRSLSVMYSQSMFTQRPESHLTTWLAGMCLSSENS
jgi:hypothetical protein